MTRTSGIWRIFCQFFTIVLIVGIACNVQGTKAESSEDRIDHKDVTKQPTVAPKIPSIKAEHEDVETLTLHELEVKQWQLGMNLRHLVNEYQSVRHELDQLRHNKGDENHEEHISGDNSEEHHDNEEHDHGIKHSQDRQTMHHSHYGKDHDDAHFHEKSRHSFGDKAEHMVDHNVSTSHGKTNTRHEEKMSMKHAKHPHRDADDAQVDGHEEGVPHSGDGEDDSGHHEQDLQQHKSHLEHHFRRTHHGHKRPKHYDDEDFEPEHSSGDDSEDGGYPDGDSHDRNHQQDNSSSSHHEQISHGHVNTEAEHHSRVRESGEHHISDRSHSNNLHHDRSEYLHSQHERIHEHGIHGEDASASEHHARDERMDRRNLLDSHHERKKHQDYEYVDRLAEGYLRDGEHDNNLHHDDHRTNPTHDRATEHRVHDDDDVEPQPHSGDGSNGDINRDGDSQQRRKDPIHRDGGHGHSRQEGRVTKGIHRGRESGNHGHSHLSKKKKHGQNNADKAAIPHGTKQDQKGGKAMFSLHKHVGYESDDRKKTGIHHTDHKHRNAKHKGGSSNRNADHHIEHDTGKKSHRRETLHGGHSGKSIHRVHNPKHHKRIHHPQALHKGIHRRTTHGVDQRRTLKHVIRHQKDSRHNSQSKSVNSERAQPGSRLPYLKAKEWVNPSDYIDSDFFIDETRRVSKGEKKLIPVKVSKDYEINDDEILLLERERISRNPSMRKDRPEGYQRRRQRRALPRPLNLNENAVENQQSPVTDLNCGPIKNGVFLYERVECRLCQCINGVLKCEPKPLQCRNKNEDNMCYLENGKAFSEGAMHYDGCNHCVCRKREWLCTRLRCRYAQYNYTNYARLSDNEDGQTRPVDTCMECDRDPVTPVCGPDWKTYRSLCHARFCGNYDIDEVKQGPCETIDPCQDAECGDHEVCVPFPRGPCLIAKTRGGNHVECRQHQCHALDHECPDDTLPKDMVCGEDGVSYPSQCHSVRNSIGFAYRGPCRETCQQGNTQVCITDGVTLQSACHANLFNRHVDYPGSCEVMPAKPEVVRKEDGGSVYVNRRCGKVQELARCYYPVCQSTVVPEGSCCPVCGAALSIRVDRAIASDLAAFTVLKPTIEFDSFQAVQEFIRHIQDPQNLRKCRLTVDFTDRKDIAVLFTPRQNGYLPFCEQAAQHTVDYVNSHTDSSKPLEALMAAAVVVEVGQTKIGIEIESRVRRRARRDEHSQHHPSYSDASASSPMNQILNFVVFFTLFWVVNH